MTKESKYIQDKNVVFRETFNSKYDVKRKHGNLFGNIIFKRGEVSFNQEDEAGFTYPTNNFIQSQHLRCTLEHLNSTRSVFELKYSDGTYASLWLTPDDKFLFQGIDNIYINGELFNIVNTVPLGSEIDLVIEYSDVKLTKEIGIGDPPNFGAAFEFTIDTTLGTGTADFTLPLRSGYNYNMLVDWGDDTTSTITTFDDPDITHTYPSGGTYQISIRGVCEAWYFNNGGDKLKLISVDQLGDIGLLAIDYGFWGCSNLVSFSGDNPNWTSSVTNFSFAWRNCSSLTEFPQLDSSSVTSFQNAWFGCSSLTSFPQLDSSSVNTFSNAWRGCSSLTSFPQLDSSNVTIFFYAWYGCSSLTSFPQIDTSKGTNFMSTWQNCSSLTSFPQIVISGATSLLDCFNNCSSLTSIDVSNWDVSKVTNMRGVFREMTSLITLDLSNWDTSSVINFSTIFYFSSALSTLILPANFVTSKATTINQMFTNCNALQSIDTSSWDVSNAVSLSQTFQGCTSLIDLQIQDWQIQNITSMINMCLNTTIPTTTYNQILINWNSIRSDWTNLTDLEIDFGDSKYTLGGAAEAARTSIINNGATNLQDGGFV